MINEYEENMTRDELKQFHGAKGGYVLKDEEFTKYKDWLQVLAAAKEFELAFPELASGARYSTQEFAKLYAERQNLLTEL